MRVSPERQSAWCKQGLTSLYCHSVSISCWQAQNVPMKGLPLFQRSSGLYLLSGGLSGTVLVLIKLWRECQDKAQFSTRTVVWQNRNCPHPRNATRFSKIMFLASVVMAILLTCLMFSIDYYISAS